MTRLAVLLCVAMKACATGSLLLSNTAVTYTVPTGPPFSALNDFRLELRIHNLTPNTAANEYANIWQGGPFAILRGGAGYDTIRIQCSPSVVVAYVGSATDILVRVQRSGSSGKFFVETFPTNGIGTIRKPEGPGSTASGPLNFAGTRKLGGPGAAGLALAWVRWYSSTVPIDSSAPTNAGSGDLATWDFEAGPSAPSMSMTISGGTGTYIPTPVYPPVPAIVFRGVPEWNATEPTVRARVPVYVDGSASSSLADDPTLAYEWRQLAGPSLLTFSTSRQAATTITGTLFGEYLIELAVEDSTGQTARKRITFGAVETDDSDVVIVPDRRTGELLGSQIRLGANPWPYADERNKVWADLLGSKQGSVYTDRWNTRLTGRGNGTVSIAKGTRIVTGINTEFRREFCAGGSAPVNGAKIVVWYEVEPGTFGRWRIPILSCDSDTQITGSAAWSQSSASGVFYSYMDDGDVGLWSGQTFSINYYDNVLAFYALHYRSGLTRYKTYAQWLADKWWSYPAIDWGRQYTSTAGDIGSRLATRLQSLTGLLLRTIETDDPKMWAGLSRLWEYQIFEAKQRPTELGEREAGLRLGAIAECASFASPVQAQTCRERLNMWVSQNWLPTQKAAGNWETYSSSEPGSYGSVYNNKPAVVTLGSNRVTVPASINWLGLLRTGNQILFYDSDGRWQPSSNQLDKVSYVGKVVDSTTIELLDPQTNRPIAYAAATNKSKGWTVSNLVGWGTQPFMLGLVGAALNQTANALDLHYPDTASRTRRALVKLTGWLRDTGYNPADRGLFYGRGFVNCENGRQCVGGRGYAAETFSALAAAYRVDKDPDTKTFGDLLYGAVFGKLGGPQSDAYANTDLDNIAGVSTSIGKMFGFYFGKGFAAQWPAVRGQTTTIAQYQEPEPCMGECMTPIEEPSCSFIITSSHITAPVTGSQGTLTVTASGPQCSWKALVNTSWTQVYPTEGIGSGVITYTVFPNYTGVERTTQILIGGEVATIAQVAGTGSADERFVGQLYFNMFGRVPTPEEVRLQSTRGLVNGRAALTLEFLRSEEFNMGDRFVAGLYVGLLNRDPEYGGWLFQRTAISTGQVNPFQLIDNFLQSAEYTLNFGSPSDREFVRLMYKYILLREPTDAEVTFQASALTSGLTRVQMAWAMLRSPEFETGTDPRLTTFLIFATLQNREPTAIELEECSKAIRAGTPLSLLIEALL